MRLPTVIILLFVLSHSLACHAAPDTWHHVKQIVLGKAGASHLIADIEFENTGLEGFGEFYVAFQTRPASQGRKIVMDTGAGTLDNLSLEAQDYVHLGRKQIFISSQMGRVCTYLLDYNGRRVRNLYARDEGRVDVKPMRVGLHELRLVEIWSIYQYTDGEEDLGVGFKRGKYQVIRTLRWRHGRFVPLFPSPTTIK